MRHWRLIPLLLVSIAMPETGKPQQNVFAKEAVESLKSFGITPFPSDMTATGTSCGFPRPSRK